MVHFCLVTTLATKVDVLSTRLYIDIINKEATTINDCDLRKRQSMKIDMHQIDCLEYMKQQGDKVFDLTVTSPPYDNLRTYNQDDWDWSENDWKPIIKELYRVTADGGVVVWVVGDATIKGSETGTSFKQALHAMDCGFRLHDTMIWNKGGFSAVGALQTRYAPVSEYMFVWSKGKPKTFNPIRDRKSKHGGKRITRTKRLPCGETKKYPDYMATEYGQRFNVWDLQPVKSNKSGHPAPFPENLAHDHIISWSNQGDTVFDPFMGSGTTAVACKKTGRNFVGTEIDPTYYQIACNRVKSIPEEDFDWVYQTNGERDE